MEKLLLLFTDYEAIMTIRVSKSEYKQKFLISSVKKRNKRSYENKDKDK